MSINVEDDGQKQKKISNYLILNILGGHFDLCPWNTKFYLDICKCHFYQIPEILHSQEEHGWTTKILVGKNLWWRSIKRK